MSNPTATDPTPSQAEPALPPLDPKIGLMCIAADQLIPLFKAGSIDTALARQMAVSAIEAYNPETRADYVNVARTIAFSMAALALLGQASSQDVTMKEKLRAYGRANALNRSADQSERSMMQRRRYQLANPSVEQPGDGTETPQPGPQMPGLEIPGREIEDAQMQAAIADAMREYLATRQPANRETAPIPATTSQPPASTGIFPSPAPAMPSPIRSAGVVLSPTAPHKQGLLHQTAIHRALDQGSAQHPG